MIAGRPRGEAKLRRALFADEGDASSASIAGFNTAMRKCSQGSPRCARYRARRSLSPPQRLMEHLGAVIRFPSCLEMTSWNRIDPFGQRFVSPSEEVK